MNKGFLVLVAAGVLLMSRKKYTELLGLRLNNPLNLKEFHNDQNDWIGEHPLNLHATFEEFISPEYGIRAGGKTLKNYFVIHGLDNVEKIVNRFAPPEDNNPTRIYAANVAARMGLATNEPFNVPGRIDELVKAMMIQEQGYLPFSDDFIYHSIRLEA